MTDNLAPTPATGAHASASAMTAEAGAIGTGIAAELLAEGNSIRPFRVNVSEAKLGDLRRRILATVWPERETVSDQSQGVQLATMRKLAEYWATDYDWRRCETRLNALPNFITEIDGLDIHFIHVRSRHENALPVIVTHGWPGSIVEQLKIVEPLTDPTAHGGTAEDAFHVVIPSLPGYGFSGKPATTGWDPPRIARAWASLMKRLGYAKFVAQGGDWGSLVTEQMGAQAPPGLLGIHTNLPSAVPAEILQALPGHVPPPGLSAEESLAFEGLDAFFSHGLAYALEMGARPQTLYSLADSPVGLAAFLYDKFAGWTDSGGEPERALSRDDMLDDITLYWLTNTAISAARLYWENRIVFFVPTGVEIPVAISAFPAELYQCPRSWAERAYPRLVHYNRLPKGGHFAAWEQPGLLTQEMRAGFRSLR